MKNDEGMKDAETDPKERYGWFVLLDNEKRINAPSLK
jgi:hypothetical protein